MCCSFLGQIAYGSLMLLALGLTLASMFTPGWQQIKHVDGKDLNFGIFFCHNATTSDTKGAESGTDYCKEWWKKQSPEMKAVIACMCLAVVVEVVAIAWNIFTICACCCKKYLVHPLPALALVAAIFLAIAVGIYVSIKDAQKGLKPGTISYSFYLACAALAACIADIIVGSLTVTLAKHCL
ncbi:hypothetical protein QR680_012124 [Steinernema hermaphroditum]|uniref:Uncharacterized protein n=1 Tax=Steinernema hermaphroditum TaxID=289476 RepID=A0AA39I101_9BILA|nr:hypothetical protein QR680_012124 [Steinernema hermaphroditum]